MCISCFPACSRYSCTALITLFLFLSDGAQALIAESEIASCRKHCRNSTQSGLCSAVAGTENVQASQKYITGLDSRRIAKQPELRYIWLFYLVALSAALYTSKFLVVIYNPMARLCPSIWNCSNCGKVNPGQVGFVLLRREWACDFSLFYLKDFKSDVPACHTVLYLMPASTLTYSDASDDSEGDNIAWWESMWHIRQVKNEKSFQKAVVSPGG